MMECRVEMFAEVRIVADVGRNGGLWGVIEMVAVVEKANMVQENWFDGKIGWISRRWRWTWWCWSKRDDAGKRHRWFVILFGLNKPWSSSKVWVMILARWFSRWLDDVDRWDIFGRVECSRDQNTWSRSHPVDIAVLSTEYEKSCLNNLEVFSNGADMIDLNSRIHHPWQALEECKVRCDIDIHVFHTRLFPEQNRTLRLRHHQDSRSAHHTLDSSSDTVGYLDRCRWDGRNTRRCFCPQKLRLWTAVSWFSEQSLRSLPLSQHWERNIGSENQTKALNSDILLLLPSARTGGWDSRDTLRRDQLVLTIARRSSLVLFWSNNWEKVNIWSCNPGTPSETDAWYRSKFDARKQYSISVFNSHFGWLTYRRQWWTRRYCSSDVPVFVKNSRKLTVGWRKTMEKTYHRSIAREWRSDVLKQGRRPKKSHLIPSLDDRCSIREWHVMKVSELLKDGWGRKSWYLVLWIFAAERDGKYFFYSCRQPSTSVALVSNFRTYETIETRSGLFDSNEFFTADRASKIPRPMSEEKIFLNPVHGVLFSHCDKGKRE